MENCDGLSANNYNYNSLPTTPAVEIKSSFQDCEETFLDEEGWIEEAKGVIRDIEKYVQFVCVSNVLASSRSNIFINLTTRETTEYTIELTQQGFKVVGSGHDTNNLTEEIIYETPYSLLDTISPAYRQAFGDHLTDQLLKLQAIRTTEAEAEETVSEN
ncbi:GSK3-beta interaction protein [Eurytemora carolleeae]|uniref:GSK3-beta interaction protein n=1 Tax=Eurytemora carolleeae TaxID=1294199 RepID=UPI000C779B8B|nr:GSK3-beta interaction protein [Eurytemora carolleeae]XP_023345093.1 GSK3-beta interaction protein [Eurytemora carolleeae]|eukprot:XP_023345092.1 GSK3-beta interaction protein-like [Eurytemora affinis]